VGKNRATLAHMREMNYTQAFLTEVQRCANVVSINLPHSTETDVEFMGERETSWTIRSISVANAATVFLLLLLI